jgi:hypothetical protein
LTLYLGIGFRIVACESESCRRELA